MSGTTIITSTGENRFREPKVKNANPRPTCKVGLDQRGQRKVNHRSIGDRKQTFGYLAG